ncbi:uncharacterized protein F5147DRAFT_761255 [Suillus discolor]|uniref:Uncharacterized protein n=1 Tax=Suillus discolor TaxID=1912936 RepID=A0A9P7JTH5_9AGAM|nr:uncharacterized protein F5147DRAFT_761255 [Suillus discolor]KAG2107396.1 hypothetical protein F5147DRAFT_761255 [Suillus discolor]
MAQGNVTSVDPYLVQFAPDDKENPKNWSRRKRWYLTYFAGLLGFNVTFASSAPSGIATQLMAQFKLSEEFVYGCVYLLFKAYPVVFTYLLIFHPQYEAAMDKHKAGLVSPEICLNLAMSGAPLFAVTFFWFRCFNGTLFNLDLYVYLIAAASALAANTVFRSAAGAVFPLFASQMYTALDPRWASTLLGCIACLMIPIPIVLKRFASDFSLENLVINHLLKHCYGPILHARSQFAPALV